MAETIKVEVAVVLWFDASYERGEAKPDQFDGLAHLISSGSIADETGEMLTIAQDCYTQDGSFRHISHIPKANIVSIQRSEIEVVIDKVKISSIAIDRGKICSVQS